MALTVLTDATAAQDAVALSFTIPTLAIGDVVVVVGIQWDTADTINLPTGTGLTFTQRVNVAATGRQRHYIWTAVASSGGTNVVVTATVSATASIHIGALFLCPTADGYSLGATPNVASNTGNSVPTVSLAGTSGNLGIFSVGDWDANQTAPTYLNSATQDARVATASFSTQQIAHNNLTGASTTLGLSAPTYTAWTMAAIEVLKSGGAPALPPMIVLKPRR